MKAPNGERVVVVLPGGRSGGRPEREILEARYGGAAERRLEIPDGGLDTPYGRLYRPLGQWQQILVLMAAFFGSPGVAWITAGLIGDLSETARTVLCVPYLLIFFMGYSLWIARLNVIAFQLIGRSLIKPLFMLLVLRRKPPSLEDALPDREKLLEMLVRAQKAGALFSTVGWPVGLAAGVGAMLFDSTRSAGTLFGLVAATCAGWGCVLGYWGRHGWLPFAEED